MLTCQQKSFHEMKLIISATLTKIIKKGLKKKRKKEKKRREDAWHLFGLAITRPMTSDGWFLQLLLFFFFHSLSLFYCYPLDFPWCTSKSFLQIMFISFLASSSKALFEVPSFLTVSETLALPFANRTVILAWHLTNHKFFEFFVYVHSICFLHLDMCYVGQFQTRQPKLPYIWELIATTSCWRSSQHLSRWRK